MNTIEEQWKKFSDLVMPKDATDIQRTEMRRAFYAGVQAMLHIQYNIGDSSINEDEAIKIMQDIQTECKFFAAEVSVGIA